MLPILRILPVGGVLLAILILVLALSPPDGSRSSLTAAIAPARGALVDRERHPEWRQFLILAAVRRADELNRLRELPDTPTHTENKPAAPKVASRPGGRSGPDPDDTGSVNETPGLPIEIGERSSTELPVSSQAETSPEIKSPGERTKSQRENRRRAVRTRHVRATPSSAQYNFLEMLFGGQSYQQPAHPQAAQPYQQPSSLAPQTSQSDFSVVPRTNPY